MPKMEAPKQADTSSPSSSKRANTGKRTINPADSRQDGDDPIDPTHLDPEEKAWSTTNFLMQTKKEEPTNPADLDPEEKAWSTARYEGPTTTTSSSTVPRISKATDDQDEDEDDDDDDEDDEEDGDEDPASALPPPRPASFAPFYTLIVDPRTKLHAHPTVHYIFADDDPELLTDALLRSADSTAAGNATGGPPERKAPTGGEGDSVVDERTVIIDLAADGRSVLSATSLAPEWQGVTTGISAAPSWQGGHNNSNNNDHGGGGGGGAGDGGEGGTGKDLMLRISGVESRDRGGPKKNESRDLEALMRDFESRLGELDGVLGGGGEFPEGELEGDGNDGGGGAVETKHQQQQQQQQEGEDEEEDEDED
jgi:hypothetical protein